MLPVVYVKPYKTSALAQEVIRQLLLEGLEADRLLDGRELVAIKVHIGERGNRTYVHPSYVAATVSLMKSLGHEVFVTDTTTLYKGPRSTGVGCMNVAYENGFTPEAITAPFIVADGLRGEDGVSYYFGRGGVEVSVARAVCDADALVFLSHAKGHGMSGFGGALKNLAMGCVTKATKRYQHDPYKPVLASPDLCNGCGKCVEGCLQRAVALEGGLPVFKDEACVRCGGCVARCPTKALRVPEGATEEFNRRLGVVAAALVSYLREFGKPAIYINIAENITRFCDCVPSPNELIARNAGILASLDPVAVDAASISEIDRALYPEFRTLSDVNSVDPWTHIRVASSCGAGSLSYSLSLV